MAHYSFLSPDRRSVLIVEMDRSSIFQPCRLLPFDGQSTGRQVGPRGQCTAAAWSPDGEWMYFSVAVNGMRHLWRQRARDGEPEQITFGPTDEDGVVVTSEGQSLLTAIGQETKRHLASRRRRRAPDHDGRLRILAKAFHRRPPPLLPSQAEPQFQRHRAANPRPDLGQHRPSAARSVGDAVCHFSRRTRGRLRNPISGWHL
jgi:hypothetical protein